MFTVVFSIVQLHQKGCACAWLIFTARRYASAVLTVIVCLSVCLSVRPSVCLSQVGVVQRWLNLGSD